VKKEELLFDKVNELLARIGAPKFLNKSGPKKYTLAEQVHALFLRGEWQCSFRRTKSLCQSLGITCPSKSALQSILQRLPWKWLQQMLQATVNRIAHVAAMDGTTLERHAFGMHYAIRSNMNVYRRKNAKLSILADTRSKKLLSMLARKHPAHDIKDARRLIARAAIKPNIITADKAYDAEWFRELLAEEGIDSCIPVRKNAYKGWYRKHSRCDGRTYRRRRIVESTFFKFKQLFGRSVNCVNARTMRAEIHIRGILHNLESYYLQRFRTSPNVGFILGHSRFPHAALCNVHEYISQGVLVAYYVLHAP